MQDFVLLLLTDLLPASDLVRLSLVCRECHNIIWGVIQSVVGGNRPVHRGCFQASVSHSVGETCVRIPLQTPSLVCMHELLVMDRTELLSRVPYFFIQIDAPFAAYTMPITEVLYSGRYRRAQPKIPGMSSLNVCRMATTW